MNYSDIKTIALTYADSQDPEMINAIPAFMKVVESRLNRWMAVQKQVTTIEIPYQLNVQEYSLPADYLSVSNLEHVYPLYVPESRYPYVYVPYKENILQTFDGINAYSYSISGNTLFVSIIPSQDTVDNNAIRLQYFNRLIPLIDSTDTNWMSDLNPDCYIFGLMVEMNAFKKDKESTALWEQRFKEAVDDIKFQDTEYRWNGPTLYMRAI